MFPEFQQLTERSRVDKTGLDSSILKGWSTGKRQRKQSWNLKIISEYKKKKKKWLENFLQQSLVFFPQLLHYYRKSKLFLCFSLFLGANVTGYKINLSIMICVLKHLKLIFIEITFL